MKFDRKIYWMFALFAALSCLPNKYEAKHSYEHVALPDLKCLSQQEMNKLLGLSAGSRGHEEMSKSKIYKFNLNLYDSFVYVDHFNIDYILSEDSLFRDSHKTFEKELRQYASFLGIPDTIAQNMLIEQSVYAIRIMNKVGAYDMHSSLRMGKMIIFQTYSGKELIFSPDVSGVKSKYWRSFLESHSPIVEYWWVR